MSKYAEHLKDQTYYSELYDQRTIEKCRSWESSKYSKDISKLKGKEKELEEIKRKCFHDVAIPMSLHFIKAERAAKKSEVIQEWMKRDKEKDEKLANAREPQGIRCLGCSSRLENCISRDLMDNHQGQEEVLFMFECKRCGKRRSYWESGKEWDYKPTCVKCKSEKVEVISSRKNNTTTAKYSWLHCGYVETDTFDFGKNKEEVEPDFEANRKKYCMSEYEGAEFLRQAEEMGKIVDSWKEKDRNKEIYDAINRIKKLTISELQNLLSPIIEKAGYAKLEFEKPELQKDVILGFSLQDSKSGRSEMESVYELQKLFKKVLADTNWRLMSDGVNYRLGFLTGRLRGVEGEENLRKLIENDFKKKCRGRVATNLT
jgi:predicted Zn-ribbon and HTH transcriptional regulator